MMMVSQPRPALACLTNCSGPTAPPVVYGYPSTVGNAINLSGGAVVYRMGGPSFGRGGSQTSPPAANPQPGTPCTVSQTDWLTYHTGPDGSIIGTFGSYVFVLVTPNGTVIDQPPTTLDAGILRQNSGTYRANPNGTVTCQFSSPFWTTVITNPGQPYPGFIWVAAPPVAGAPAQVPVLPAVAGAVGQIHGKAGTVAAVPTGSGLTGAATCFWVQNLGIPQELDQVIYLVGPPQAEGRQVIYTLILRISFAGIQWNFDDPYGNGQVAPPSRCGDQVAHPLLTAHKYAADSQNAHPDGLYHVTAFESYTVAVDLYWFDSAGPHHVALPFAPQTIPLAAFPEFVIQEMGVPVAVSPTP
jgi:hypothetical protein